MKINKEFFNRNPEIVAKELLGKVIVRRINNKTLSGKIVETEAYFDKRDPASWARFNGDLKKTMEMEAGTILVKMVHNNWLLNFVTGEKGKAEAVLIRAIEALNFNGKCNGPGLLTKALFIDKRFNKKNIFNNGEIELIDLKDKEMFEIVKSKRVGVKKDLKKKLRFYIYEK